MFLNSEVYFSTFLFCIILQNLRLTNVFRKYLSKNKLLLSTINSAPPPPPQWSLIFKNAQNHNSHTKIGTEKFYLKINLFSKDSNNSKLLLILQHRVLENSNINSWFSIERTRNCCSFQVTCFCGGELF